MLAGGQLHVPSAHNRRGADHRAICGQPLPQFVVIDVALQVGQHLVMLVVGDIGKVGKPGVCGAQLGGVGVQMTVRARAPCRAVDRPDAARSVGFLETIEAKATVL